MRGRGRGRGGSDKGRPRREMPKEVNISRKMTYLLRHGSSTEGIFQDDAGWMNVKDVLEWRDLKSQRITFADVRAIVASDDKQRFTLEPLPASPPHTSVRPTSPTSPNLIPTTVSPVLISAVTSGSTAGDPSHFRIRAAQGHSRKDLDRSQLYTQIHESDPDCPSIVVHGTNKSNWEKIKASGGLKSMNRGEIHFARDVVKNLAPLKRGDDRANFVRVPKDEEVISGMRRDSSVCIWVDVRGSMKAGVEWWRSKNGVVLTDGLDGLLGMEWIVWAERRGGEEVYWGDREKGIVMRERQRKVGAEPVLEVTAASPEEAVLNGLKNLDVRDEAEEDAVVRDKKNKFDEMIKENWDDSREVSPER